MSLCVVCGEDIPTGREQYSNAWEKVRRLSPCCSDSCLQRFDPDVHWLPGVAPPSAMPEDTARLLSVAQQRIVRGDQARVVVRELLVAGVPIARIRGLCIQTGNTAINQKRDRHELGILSMIGGFLGLLSGHGTMLVSGDRSNPESVGPALDDLDVWERRFGSSPP